MILYPNAKINLGLFITEKRDDGFHNLLSCFYPVNWKEALEIIPAEKLLFSSTGIAIPGQTEDNLCLKAYNLIADDHDIPPVNIHLHKAIPIGAGLGGGSADAAFTLKGLNELFELQLSSERLIEYARQLGSDCAFFIENKPKLCFEKGDRFKDVDLDLSQYSIALINPGIHIGTKEAYSLIVPKKPDVDLATALQNQSVDKWHSFLHNDFEKSAFKLYPKIESLKKLLYDAGAHYASMTGSGSTVFGIFDSKTNLENIDPSYTLRWV